MNFYEWGINELQSNGLSSDQAEAIMKSEINENTTMSGRWTDDIVEYPDFMKNILWLSIQRITLEFIKENCPKAWFRPLFDLDHPLRKEFEALQKF